MMLVLWDTVIICMYEYSDCTIDWIQYTWQTKDTSCLRDGARGFDGGEGGGGSGDDDDSGDDSTDDSDDSGDYNCNYKSCIKLSGMSSSGTYDFNQMVFSSML